MQSREIGTGDELAHDGRSPGLPPEPPCHRVGRVGVTSVRIGLERCAQATVPQHPLDTDWRRAVGQHLCRRGVAEHVRSHVADSTPSPLQIH